jgi:ElaB/YqjD/DUF883 family membrane-anchored ribosome-binding protein
MARTSSIEQIGDTVKAHVSDAVDHVTDAANSASDAVRRHSSRLADAAQEYYEEFDSRALANRARGLVGEYPVASLLVAAGVGYLLARWLRD